MGPLTGGVPLTLIAKIAQPISEKLGFKTGKNRREHLTERPGVVIVAILCSLAQNGQKLHEVETATAGCTIRAAIPSDVWSLKGDLLISIRAENDITVVEAGITIPGQVYDWGKMQPRSRPLVQRLRISSPRPRSHSAYRCSEHVPSSHVGPPLSR